MKRQRTFFPSLVALGILLLWLILHLVLRSQAITEPYVVAHRGGAGLAPENTLAAVSEAIDRGVKSIEVDVQRTSDGVLVIVHDTTVERTTNGKGIVGELTWEEISHLDAGSHFSPKFAGERIPTLDNILEMTTEKSVTLFLEAKSPKNYHGIEMQIAEAIQRLEAKDQVVVISFDHEWLKRFEETAPDMRLGWLSLWMGKTPQSLKCTIADVCWISIIIDPTLVTRLHDKDYEVVVWTVNAPWLMKVMLWLGVDGITTDRPDLWAEVTDIRR